MHSAVYFEIMELKDRYRHVNAIELELGPCNNLYNTAFFIHLGCYDDVIDA